VAVDIVFETHSTSTDNEAGIATGWLGGELSAYGLLQAADLGERRRDDGYAAVYTSDLARAVQTAEIAFAATELTIRPDRRLRECNYGDLHGAPVARLDAVRAQRVDHPFPGGESYRDAVGRVAEFLTEVGPAHPHERILLIGHSATRWALDTLLDGADLAALVAAPFDWREGWSYRLP
jgi:broad specificity phosphatase PhoE